MIDSYPLKKRPEKAEWALAKGGPQTSPTANKLTCRDCIPGSIPIPPCLCALGRESYGPFDFDGSVQVAAQPPRDLAAACIPQWVTGSVVALGKLESCPQARIRPRMSSGERLRQGLGDARGGGTERVGALRAVLKDTAPVPSLALQPASAEKGSEKGRRFRRYSGPTVFSPGKTRDDDTGEDGLGASGTASLAGAAARSFFSRAYRQRRWLATDPTPDSTCDGDRSRPPGNRNSRLSCRLGEDNVGQRRSWRG